MKKILSFVIVLAAAAMVSCAGNTNKKAAEAEAETVEAAAAEETAEKCECGECEACTEKCECCEACAEKAEAANE